MSSRTATEGIAELALKPLKRFLEIEASSAIVLFGATVVALVWANSPYADAYEALWKFPLGIAVGNTVFVKSLHFWVNEGLMAVFFLVVALEIRSELHDGSLSEFRRAALPIAAAFGGILVPAAVYLALAGDPALQRGWAIPTATDTAFAVGVLALLGSRIPYELRVLLLTLAIADDVAAILIIAIYYSSGLELAGVAWVAAGSAGVLCLQRLGTQGILAYAVPGAVVWAGMVRSGLHPTLAGVLLGLMTPASVRANSDSILRRVTAASERLRHRLRRGEREPASLLPPAREVESGPRYALPPAMRARDALHPWVAYGVMPLFALANAGIELDGATRALTVPLAAGIALGLVVGKPVGILLLSAACVRLGICILPAQVTWPGVAVVGCLAGIGFTMSTFIGTLAFTDEQMLSAAKLTIFAASALAATLGVIAGRMLLPVQTKKSRAQGSGKA